MGYRESVEKLLEDEAATVDLGGMLANALPDKALIFLRGSLGVGKTTLVRALLRAIGHEGPVKSPTYTLVEPYEIEGQRIFHLDLYRLESPYDLEFIGLRDLLDDALCLVEWPERGIGMLPQADLEVVIEYENTMRRVHLNAGTYQGMNILNHLD